MTRNPLLANTAGRRLGPMAQMDGLKRYLEAGLTLTKVTREHG